MTKVGHICDTNTCNPSFKELKMKLFGIRKNKEPDQAILKISGFHIEV